MIHQPGRMTISNELLRISIANVVFSFCGGRSKDQCFFPETYRNFTTSSAPDIVLTIHDGEIPVFDLENYDLVFDSGGTWRMYRMNTQYLMLMGDWEQNDGYWSAALLDYPLSTVQLFTNEERMANGLYADPFEGTFGEMLMVFWLAHHQGLLVHACGIADKSIGYLFAGESTHGKSTIAQLWQAHAEVLSDERVVIRQEGDRFRIYGTPWHSNYPVVSPRGVDLDKIFFLGHGKHNQTVARNNIESAIMLLARAFPPLWDKVGMENTLDLCDMLARKIAINDLLFVPDEDVVEFVRCVK